MSNLVIVGPTASGKSALALAVAQRAGAEIVSADSMAVYRGMDIGTAKPTRAERRQVTHHLVDVVAPDEEFSVAEFQRLATAVLAQVPRVVVVGGTGLYIDALVNGLTLPGQWPEIKAALDARPTAELWAQLAVRDAVAATKIEPGNHRRIVRALEVTIGSGRPFSSFGPGLQPSRLAIDPRTTDAPPFQLVGLRVDRAILARRIAERYTQQLGAGFLAEVRDLRATYGSRLSRTAAQALGYRELLAHIDGHGPIDEALAEAQRRTVSFAKRQERWFRRDPRIHWIDMNRASGDNIDRTAERVLADWTR